MVQAAMLVVGLGLLGAPALQGALLPFRLRGIPLDALHTQQALRRFQPRPALPAA